MPETSSNLRETIKARLIERLRDYPLNLRLPSVRDLAAEFDAAYLTVNGVMKELEWEGYIRRVPRKGAFLASRERTVLKDLQTGTTSLKTVVFAYPNYFSYTAWIRMHHAEEFAVKNGLALLEFKLNPGMGYDGVVELIRSRQDICGVILIPIPGSISRAEVGRFDELDLPVVLLSPSDFVSLTKNVWSVYPDWYRAGYLKAQWLLSLGHESLAYVQHEPVTIERQDQLIRGMHQALRESGRRQRDLVVSNIGTRAWEDSRVAAYQLTRELIASTSVTGGMYDSLRGIQGGLRALHEAGRSVPDDFALVATGVENHDEEFFESPVAVVDPASASEIDVAFSCLLTPKKQVSRQITIEPALRVPQRLIQTTPRDLSIPGK